MSAPPMSGLGITFDASTAPELQHTAHHQHHPYRGHPAHAPHLRRLNHSVSVDEGLNRRHYLHHEPMVRQPSEDSAGSGQKRVRIAAGTPEVLGGGKGEHHLPYLHQHSQLSPLSDFDLSSASDTGSSQPFSPASLSDLPSSTESGAYPTFYPISNHAPLGLTAPGMDTAQSRPYPALNPAAAAYQPVRPSRLPAFLQERQNGNGLARPHSMMELSQAYQRPATVLRGPRAEEEHVEYAEYKSSPEVEQHRPYGDESPESVPSSAGGFQRRQLERQLQEQKDLLEAERRRLRASEGRPRERSIPGVEPLRPLVHQRSRSLSAQEMRQLAAAEQARKPQPQIPQGFSGEVEDLAPSSSAQEDDERGTVISLDNRPLGGGAAEVTRQNTLLTAGASTVRRRKELGRLLAPSSKKGSIGLPNITGSPTPSTASSAVTSSTRPAPSRASAAPTISSPVALEQAKGSSRARVELDLVLETPLVVEGGLLKGKLELKVRKPKDKEGELWIGKPKIRIIGFEELASNDARYIFFHHAESISSVHSATAPSLVLPCFDTTPDSEGFCRAKLGQHAIPVRMSLPVGKGAKGPWKGKQGVVRYIAIASVKLKSKSGSNRSIAHFYRHVDVYPYLNPAITLAPAVKPLQAEGAKSLFMGGSGKVTLKASMHRKTWVAGQRCYCDVSVCNESNKKIKTLTLALVRTTTIYRPSTIEGGSSHTQSTRKKVAETILEMGKKGAKGVTAKGSWMGVDAGESSDFSHSLLVPPDELSISRGRHIEVSYTVKVSVGGSLSADVTADIPIRVIDFLSLDPPPGHVGASPLVEAPARPLARQWSSNQLRAEAASRQGGPLMSRMVSVDSLRLEELNGGRGPSRLGQPALSRVASMSSIRTDDLPRAQPLDEHESAPEHLPPPETAKQVPLALARTEALVDRALQRQIQHQASLDCISTAIASATARRQGGLRRQPSNLSSVVEQAPDELGWTEPEFDVDFSDQLQYGGGELPYIGAGSFSVDDLRVQLDDLDDVPDDPAYLDQQHSPEGLEEDIVESDSEGELDAIMQSHFSDEEDDEQTPPYPSYVPASPRRSDRPASPNKTVARPRSSSFAQPSSPVKTRTVQESPRPQRSPDKRSPDKFGFATPSSPIKACVELPDEDESDSPPPTRAPRPLPAPPTSTAHAVVRQPSGTSLRRQGGIRKTPSTRSVRSVASSVELSRPAMGSAAKVALPPSRSPSLASPKVSPVLATVRTRPPMSPTAMLPPASPRKVVKTPSPALRATRSMADLHDIRASSSAAEMPPPPVPSSVACTSSSRPGALPSVVKNKVAALETRQAQLTRLATTTQRVRARVSSGVQLSRADSVLSNASSIVPSEVSFKGLTDLTRANSVVSFKAPLLKRGIPEDAPPVPSLPPQ